MAALQDGSVLIIAPAGYGKSTLLQSLLLQQPSAQLLRLSIEDTDVAHLQTRLRPVLTEGATVMLDDLHHLHDAPEALAWLNERCLTPSGRFVLSGRMSPDATWRKRFAVFDAAQLAFSPTEAQTVLSRLRGLTPEVIEHWRIRTKGWPLMLSVLARQLDGLSDASRSRLLDRAGHTSDAELLGYLAERMIRPLPPDLLTFIQATALPTRFNDQLASVILQSTPESASALRSEVERRNLFIESAEVEGWYRYHDFVRELLFERVKRLSPAKFHDNFERIVDWFEAHGDNPNAIEHALLADSHEQASRLLDKLEDRWLWDTGRYRTYKRWVLSLPRAVLDARPKHLASLSRVLFDVSAYDEARIYMQDALRVVQTHADGDLRGWVKGAAAFMYGREGNLKAALALAREALSEPGLTVQTRQSLLNALGTNLVLVYRLTEARAVYEQSLALAQQLNNPASIFSVQHNLAFLVHQSLGQFDAARRLLRENEAFCVDKPVRRIQNLLSWAGMHENLGDWPALQKVNQQIGQATAELEQASDDQTWENWYVAMHAIGTGDYASAQRHLDTVHALALNQIDVLACEAWARAWLLRRQGKYQDCIDHADESQPHMTEAPLYQAAIGFERACAAQQLYHAAQGNPREWIATALPSLEQHARLRARPFLVRWRALLALACNQVNDGRWHKHALATLRLCANDSLKRILIGREPDLGARFWAMCLAEGFEVQQAMAALTEIGQTAPVVALLKPGKPSEVASRAAQTLAAIGKEDVIPALAEALEAVDAAPDAAPKRTLISALDALESAAPPLLSIQLMGDFTVMRGQTPIKPEDWERPAARILFQYLALNAGAKLTRDQIIEDLWPDAHPETARGSLKPTLSRMRRAIEPFLRPKSPARYFSVEGEIYRFGLAHVRLDSIDFENTVRAALNDAERHDVLPVNDALVAQLLGYQPLLPDLQYHAWTIAPRERLQDVYVKGCGYVAHARLDVGEFADAAVWAEKAIAVAPWSEESYQSLMRAESRLGDRALALRTYATCVTVLQRELGVPPSQLTEWLAQRLRADEAI